MQYQYAKQVRELKQSLIKQQEEINALKRNIDTLKTDSFMIEKYIREHYWMKRSNEDLYIIRPTKKIQSSQ